MKNKIVIFLLMLFSAGYGSAQSRKDSLIVFVGEIIDVKYSPEKNKEPKVDTVIRRGKKTVVTKVTISMDERYVARYKVLQLVYGSYKKDTLEFIVYDHYGQPAFAKYKTVLLFVSRQGDELYHEKYLFFDLYKTVDNRWASPGDPYKFDSQHRKELKPHKIKFKDKISYDLNLYDKDRIEELFPKQYFRIAKGRAYPRVGTYVEDLFTVKKNGVLKARGIF